MRRGGAGRRTAGPGDANASDARLGTASARLIDDESIVTNITHTASANGDILAGTVYGDSMVGGTGDDVLDGRASPDTMRGGAGNDIYIIEQDGGAVSEEVGFGGSGVDAGGTNDTVISYQTTTNLSVFVENLVLAGNALYGYGNAQNNHITGANGIANWLEGRGGNDTLEGGVGNDTLYGGTGDDFATSIQQTTDGGSIVAARTAVLTSPAPTKTDSRRDIPCSR